MNEYEKPSHRRCSLNVKGGHDYRRRLRPMHRVGTTFNANLTSPSSSRATVEYNSHFDSPRRSSA